MTYIPPPTWIIELTNAGGGLFPDKCISNMATDAFNP